LRTAAGAKTCGIKVGYANKAMWRVLKLETLVWAHMYEDTVHYAHGGAAEYALPAHRAPKIEPEIVFKLKEPIATAGLDAAAVLALVEWIAIGFEIIDCPFPDWQVKPTDFVAAFGLHLGLVVGEPLKIDAAMIPTLVEQLASFKLKVSKNGEFVEEGAGKNSLRSPALCLAELGGAMLKRGNIFQNANAGLAAGDLISSGTLTAGHLIQSGETWSVEVEGLPLAGLAVTLK
jgi:2-oxo-3-hexenedioate decarboxylase